MKHTLLSFTGLTRRFKRDETGATALTFALGLTVMMMGVGVGVDYAAASKAQSKSQDIADASALAAAAWIRENPDSPPETDQDGFRDGIWYKASELGWEFQDFVIGGSDGVEIKVTYHDTFATAEVKGATRPAIMGLWGHDRLDFVANANAIYARSNGGDPASVFLVLDNSGSMNWDDGNGTKRLDGLEDSVVDFMTTLNTIVADIPDGEQRPLRTAMIPFTGQCEGVGDMCDGVDDDGIVRDDIANERFGLISDDEIRQMIPRFTTNPVAALDLAEVWMRDEFDVHESELLDTSPEDYDEDEFQILQYVILMSDGANSLSDYDCTDNALPESGNWRKVGEDSEGTAYWERPHYRLVKYNYDNGSPEQRDYTGLVEAQWAFEDWNSKEFYLGWRKDSAGQDLWSTMPINTDVALRASPDERQSQYDSRTLTEHPQKWPEFADNASNDGHSVTPITRYNEDKGRSDWPGNIRQVGRNDTSAYTVTNGRPTYYTCNFTDASTRDDDMLASCARLKAAGVDVFTIGYGLEAQDYTTNWAEDPVRAISSSAAARALRNLQTCASDPVTHFKRANDAGALNQVFQAIGQNIVDESIRLSK